MFLLKKSNNGKFLSRRYQINKLKMVLSLSVLLLTHTWRHEMFKTQVESRAYVLDILWRQVCVNKSTDNDKTIFNLFFTITKSKSIQKQGQSLKEKLFQARVGSVRERFVIQCVCTLIDNGWEPIRLRDFALLL